LEDRDVRPGDDWRQWELDTLVGAYFDMLSEEVADRHPVKAEANRRLQALLPARSRGSIEYKLENVSAVLDDEHYPFIDGYKPARNYQAALRHAVLERLGGSARLAEELASYGTDDPPSTPPPSRLAEVLIDKPTGRRVGRSMGMTLSQGDWGAIRDAQLRNVGEAGERWVLDLERTELRSRGQSELAGRVEWTSKDRGDGFGYDIASFADDGTPIQIEVKTTKLGARSPFYVTRNELSVSESLQATYRVYRVFNFARSPKLYIAQGSISSGFSMDPLIYEARPA
jgi:hypothetical protein